MREAVNISTFDHSLQSLITRHVVHVRQPLSATVDFPVPYNPVPEDEACPVSHLRSQDVRTRKAVQNSGRKHTFQVAILSLKALWLFASVLQKLVALLVELQGSKRLTRCGKKAQCLCDLPSSRS